MSAKIICEIHKLPICEKCLSATSMIFASAWISHPHIIILHGIQTVHRDSWGHRHACNRSEQMNASMFSYCSLISDVHPNLTKLQLNPSTYYCASFLATLLRCWTFSHRYSIKLSFSNHHWLWYMYMYICILYSIFSRTI